jgi:nucleotide-binding universal stress UspA family protein
MDVHPLDVILVPVDYTETSLNALAVAVRLSQQQQASLYLVDVIEADRLEHATEKVYRIQALATQVAQQHQIRCLGLYCTGDPVEGIIATARDTNAGLIVAGVRTEAGQQALRSLNTVYQLIKKGECPVLSIPDHKVWPEMGRVLFPVRPIPGALDKYAFARPIILQNKAELTVLALYNPEEVISLQQLEDEIKVLKDRLTRDNVSSRVVFCPTESVAEDVLNKSAEFNSDILVITAGLNSSPDSFFMGPFTRQIIYNASIPVLAIRSEFALDSQADRVVWRYGQTDEGLAALGL